MVDLSKELLALASNNEGIAEKNLCYCSQVAGKEFVQRFKKYYILEHKVQ